MGIHWVCSAAPFNSQIEERKTQHVQRKIFQKKILKQRIIIKKEMNIEKSKEYSWLFEYSKYFLSLSLIVSKVNILWEFDGFSAKSRVQTGIVKRKTKKMDYFDLIEVVLCIFCIDEGKMKFHNGRIRIPMGRGGKWKLMKKKMDLDCYVYWFCGIERRNVWCCGWA